MSERQPDLSYHLGADDRARVRPEFDADALERLLRYLPAADRRAILPAFLYAVPSGEGGPESRNTSFSVVGVTDPVLSALLEEVWLPFWRTAPDMVVIDPYSNVPGANRERRRRGLQPGDQQFMGKGKQADDFRQTEPGRFFTELERVCPEAATSFSTPELSLPLLSLRDRITLLQRLPNNAGLTVFLDSWRAFAAENPAAILPRFD